MLHTRAIAPTRSTSRNPCPVQRLQCGESPRWSRRGPYRPLRHSRQLHSRIHSRPPRTSKINLSKRRWPHFRTIAVTDPMNPLSTMTHPKSNAPCSWMRVARTKTKRRAISPFAMPLTNISVIRRCSELFSGRIFAQKTVPNQSSITSRADDSLYF